MESFSLADRRGRLAHRHCLARPARSVDDCVDAMAVLHASDPATVFLSVMARLDDASVEAIKVALYDTRSIVRLLAMRRTLFVATRSTLGIVEASSSVAVAASERKRLQKFLAESGIDDPESWLDAVAAEVETAIPTEGAPARELTRLVPRLGTRIVMGAGTNHAQEAGATSRVLGVMAAEGRLFRGRPAGDWTGRQYRWHLREHWLGVEDAPAPSLAEASAELVRRYLSTFGPASFEDLKWWTGWPLRQLRPALEACGAVDVDLHGGPGLVLPEDLERPPTTDPWVAVLPSLDPTPMGWKERGWFLGPHADHLFDRFGNIGPTIWVDGRIVGGWSQRSDGEIVTGLLEDIGRDHQALVDREVDRLQTAIGLTVVKPSFPTPLQKELQGS